MKTNEEIKKEIYEYLKVNSNKFVSGTELKRLFGLSTFKMQGFIHELRIENEPIIATGKGYKYTNDLEELLSSYISLKKRAQSVNSAAEGLYNYIVEHNDELITNIKKMNLI